MPCSQIEDRFAGALDLGRKIIGGPLRHNEVVSPTGKFVEAAGQQSAICGIALRM